MANNRALGTAAIGTALGLAVGAATGDGRASTFGAVSGAAIGGTIGADQSERAGFSLQRRYDIAYAQCMYSKGNQVPGFQRSAAPPPPPPDGPGGPPPPRPRG
jgi:outer membrane lipoprotein SlyB